MRRPRFRNWARSELLRATGSNAFSLRTLAAYAQTEDGRATAPLLLLYAHEADCVDRLMSLVYDTHMQAEFETVEHHLAKRSAERLALRGTPMMTLPEAYRDVLAAYDNAYHAPERADEEKRILQEAGRRAMLEQGVAPSAIARRLGLDPGNLHAFLVKGQTNRLTLETAREINRLLGTMPR